MDKIEKLFRKISQKDKEKIMHLIGMIKDGDKSIKSAKIKNSDMYRVRGGNYRILYCYNGGQAVIISIEIRNDNTYKNF